VLVHSSKIAASLSIIMENMFFFLAKKTQLTVILLAMCNEQLIQGKVGYAQIVL
jgi:hypothetical protein